MARFVLSAICLVAAITLTPPARAEKCQTPDNRTFVSGGDHCLAIKTITPDGGGKGVLVVVLHGDLTSGGPANYIRFIASAAAKSGAVGVAMARPGYTLEERTSTGTATRDQNRDDRFRAAEIDSIGTAIATLKAHHNAKRVVLVGHSGGSLISGVLIGRAAPMVDAAVLISCPCHVRDWRAWRDGGDMVNAESPHMYVDRMPAGARVFALTGEKDDNTLPRFAQDYVAQAARRGIAASFALVPDAGHGMGAIKKQPQLLDAVRAAIADR